MSEKDSEDRGFKITDRRLLADEGDEKKEESKPVDEREKSAPLPPQPERPPQPETPQAPGELPEMDFTQLVMSFATSALIQMGDAPQPHGGEAMIDLEAAKHTINILGILKEKTENNLEPEERKVLDNVLAELQMRFIQKTSKK